MLNVIDISKKYANVIAIEKLSFKPNKKQVVGIVGTNGSGKTTTFRMLVNLIQPDNGTILWNEESIAHMNSNEIGYLPEERGLDDEMTIEEHVVYFARLKGKTRKEILPFIPRWLEELKIKGKKKDKIKNLSKGNKQKVQLLSTLIHNPNLIILDEPFSGLDPVNSDLLKKRILKLKENSSTNIIFSSHNMDYIEEICDQLIMVHRGKVLFNNELKEVKRLFGKKSLLISRNENTEKILLENKMRISKVERSNDSILRVTLKDEEVGKDIFTEVVKFGFIEVFHQDYLTLDEIFRKVIKENE